MKTNDYIILNQENATQGRGYKERENLQQLNTFLICMMFSLFIAFALYIYFASVLSKY
jgi:hypothetical protein